MLTSDDILTLTGGMLQLWVSAIWSRGDASIPLVNHGTCLHIGNGFVAHGDSDAIFRLFSRGNAVGSKQGPDSDKQRKKNYYH